MRAPGSPIRSRQRDRATADEVSEHSPVTAPSGWTRDPTAADLPVEFSDFEPKPTDMRRTGGQASHASTSLWPSPTRPPVTVCTGDLDLVERRARPWDRLVQPAGRRPGLVAGGRRRVGRGTASGRRPSSTAHAVAGAAQFLPGNNADDSTFREFARPRTLTAIFSDGSTTLLHLKDAPTLQRFPVHVTTRSVRLVIRSVYLGTDYPATCISEVEFGTRRAPGYAPFARLIDDPHATGRLTAWAGPPAPAPRLPADAANSQVVQDDEPTPAET